MAWIDRGEIPNISLPVTLAGLIRHAARCPGCQPIQIGDLTPVKSPALQGPRCVKVSIMLKPSAAAWLDAFRRQHRWSRSTAAAVLIENGLTEAKQEEGQSWD